MIALWVEGGSLTGAVFGISMYKAGPLKFCQNCQSTNFYFYLLSKVLMNFSCIRVYQNWRKIKGVIFPKFRASKVLSDLPINQFLFLSAF
jgi:hypothetical protein